MLEDVRRAAPDVRPPELAVQAPKTAIAGAPLTVTVSATDRSGVAGVTLFIGAGDAFPMATTDGETWQVAIPAELVPAGELRLWIEATDRAGNGPARWGSAEMPRLCAVTDPAPPIADPLTTATIEPPPEADTPVWETWWFWTTIGVGVAGVGTLVYFLVPRSSGPPPDDAADLSVEVRWAR